MFVKEINETIRGWLLFSSILYIAQLIKHGLASFYSAVSAAKRVHSFASLWHNVEHLTCTNRPWMIVFSTYLSLDIWSRKFISENPTSIGRIKLFILVHYKILFTFIKYVKFLQYYYSIKIILWLKNPK